MKPSDVKGYTVSSSNAIKPYIAQITINRKTHYLGSFKTAREAHKAYSDERKANAIALKGQPWTVEQETALVEFMLVCFAVGDKTEEALRKSSEKFGRNCRDRWFKYGFTEMYANEIKEAKEKAKKSK